MRQRKWYSLALVAVLITVLAVPAAGIAKPGGGAPVVSGQTVFLPDMYEPADDDPATAPMLPATSYHTIHSDADEDWSRFTVEETGTPYFLEARRLDGHQGEPDMWLYQKEDDNSMTLLASDGDYDTSWGTYDDIIYWEAPAPGEYYLLVSNGDYFSSDAGCAYELTRTKGIARRISGMDRYSTAVAVSQTIRRETDNPGWGTGYSPEAVVVASGENFPDALAGVVLASYYDSVLLLTRAGSLPSQTAAEIERLGRSAYWDEDEFEVIILGGESAVSKAVADEIAQMTSVTRVTRLGGASRHETTALIAEAADDYYGTGDQAFIVNGMVFADALAAGPVAAYRDGVILTVEQNSLPQATIDAIADRGITRVVLVGGTAAISDAVETQIGALPGITEVDRLEGSDRYETAREVAEYGVSFGMDGYGQTVDYGEWFGMGPIVVSGANFPDALSAGVMSWYKLSPLLLTRPDMLSASVKTFLDDNGPTEEPSYLVGGTAAVSESTFAAFNGYYKSWLP